MNFDELAERFERHSLRIANGRVNEALTTVATSQVASQYVNFALNDWEYFLEITSLKREPSLYPVIDYAPLYDYQYGSPPLELNPQYGVDEDIYVIAYDSSKACLEDVANWCFRFSKSDYRYLEVRYSSKGGCIYLFKPNNLDHKTVLF